MNDKKVAFILCVNDEVYFEECLKYIENLYVPKDFEIEVIAMRNEKSITSAYNKAIEKTDAKYKVYLHQDVLFINKNFITDFINIFEENKMIGMLGVAGCKTLPQNGIWWEANDCTGSLYDTHAGKITMYLLNKNNIDEVEYVKAIDGVVMITQFDVKWREDIFDGWHFYDISQSFEMLKIGYDLAVINYSVPWCIHDCGISNLDASYEKYRKLFLKQYSACI